MVAKPQVPKPVIVHETMAELGMSDRYIPVSHHSSWHTFKGRYVYHADARLPETTSQLEQTVWDGFVRDAQERYKDIDLVAAVRIKFEKAYLCRDVDSVLMFEDTHEAVEGNPRRDGKTIRGKFQQWAIDYIITADLFNLR